jgi:hypothetical protein
VEHLRSQIAVIQPRGNDGAGLLLSAAGRLGLGRHDAARRAFERDQIGHGPHVVSELAEAASRTGDVAPARAALEWLSQRTSVAQTDWVLGIETRVRALLSDGDAAERCYRVSIERLERTPVHAELARSHLLYGEWLRRGRRRADAREQLRTAHDVLEEMGIGPFAERARRELAATGKTACRRAIETSLEVTAQEAHIARLARDGLSNPEIGARMFLSAPHHPVPPEQGVRQVRHQLAQPARPRPPQRPAVPRPQEQDAFSQVNACPSCPRAVGSGAADRGAHAWLMFCDHWPFALFSGGYERTLTGRDFQGMRAGYPTWTRPRCPQSPHPRAGGTL